MDASFSASPIAYAPDTASRHIRAPLVAVALWMFLWANLDSGFWDIAPAQTLSGWLLAIRGCLPFVVLPAAAFLLIRRGVLPSPRFAPTTLLFAYGCLAAISGLFSPEPAWAAYWSIAYLGTILTAWATIDASRPLESARTLLFISWIVTFLVAAYLGHSSSAMIFGHSVSAYNRPESGLDKLSRASGVARWAAVPGLVCLVRAFYSRRLVWVAALLGAAAFCFFIVFRMQSRGAVLGSAAALIFIVVLSTRIRRFALPLTLFSGLFLFLFTPAGSVSDTVVDYLKRGQTDELFESLSGRTRAYEHAMTAISDAPIFGRGQWTDRLVIYEHSHNSFIQALLNAGIAGAIPYFSSWIAGWVLFFRLRNRWRWLADTDRVCLIESGAVMMFFTVRSMPETTTASYAVDLLVVTAIYLYLEVLSLDTARRRVSAWIPYRAGIPDVPRRAQAAQLPRKALQP